MTTPMVTTATQATHPVAVRTQGLNKSFGDGENRLHVLHDINLDLRSGSMNYIVGPSGCGKTTLISIMAGILTAESGETTLFGTPIHQLKSSQKAKFRRENIGFIFQQFNLVATITNAENVAVPLLIQGKPHGKAIEQAKLLLEQVGLGDKVNGFPRDLSGGQQQRVAIARALINNPRLVVCDEPTSALDGKTGAQILELLTVVARDPNRCVVVVTHDNRIYKYADQLIEMEDGRIKSIQQVDHSKPSQF